MVERFQHCDTEGRGRSLVCGPAPIKPGDVVLTEEPAAYVDITGDDPEVSRRVKDFGRLQRNPVRVRMCLSCGGGVAVVSPYLLLRVFKSTYSLVILVVCATLQQTVYRTRAHARARSLNRALT